MRLFILAGLLVADVQPTTGQEPYQLTFGPGISTSPCWSPDGTQIAFERDHDIWVIPVTGGTPTQLTFDPAEDDEPAWSPDGNLIAFTSRYRGGSPGASYLHGASNWRPRNATRGHPGGQRTTLCLVA